MLQPLWKTVWKFLKYLTYTNHITQPFHFLYRPKKNESIHGHTNTECELSWQCYLQYTKAIQVPIILSDSIYIKF